MTKQRIAQFKYDGRESRFEPNKGDVVTVFLLPIEQDPDCDPWFPEFPGERQPRRFSVERDGECIELMVVRPIAPWSAVDGMHDQLSARGYSLV
tara:strand:- start:739 stop:1020 length:282 start_codon:yes stop_codon:yes gene_type:complete